MPTEVLPGGEIDEAIEVLANPIEQTFNEGKDSKECVVRMNVSDSEISQNDSDSDATECSSQPNIEDRNAFIQEPKELSHIEEYTRGICTNKSLQKPNDNFKEDSKKIVRGSATSNHEADGIEEDHGQGDEQLSIESSDEVKKECVVDCNESIITAKDDSGLKSIVCNDKSRENKDEKDLEVLDPA